MVASSRRRSTRRNRWPGLCSASVVSQMHGPYGKSPCTAIHSSSACNAVTTSTVWLQEGAYGFRHCLGMRADLQMRRQLGEGVVQARRRVAAALPALARLARWALPCLAGGFLRLRWGDPYTTHWRCVSLGMGISPRSASSCRRFRRQQADSRSVDHRQSHENHTKLSQVRQRPREPHPARTCHMQTGNLRRVISTLVRGRSWAGRI